MSDWDAVQGMVAAATEAFGGVDILCANAGAFPQSKMIDMEVEVPRDTGPNAPRATWKLNGTIRVATSDDELSGAEHRQG